MINFNKKNEKPLKIKLPTEKVTDPVVSSTKKGYASPGLIQANKKPTK